MCILLVNDARSANHYGERLLAFDDALLDDGSFDPCIVKEVEYIVFTRKEVTDLKDELKELHELLENMGNASPLLHIVTNIGSTQPAQSLRDYLAE